MVEVYGKLIKDLEGLHAEMVDGPKKTAFNNGIEKAREELRYFTNAYAIVEKSSQAYREVESIEAYRDFVRDEVNQETVTA